MPKNASSKKIKLYTSVREGSWNRRARLGRALVTYHTMSSFFFLNKMRRLFVARSKRIMKKIKVAKPFWVKLGKAVRIYKKPVNSRMGGGVGSFFTVRRYIGVGSYLAHYTIRRMGFSWVARSYIFHRIPTLVRARVSRLRPFSRLLLPRVRWKRKVKPRALKYKGWVKVPDKGRLFRAPLMVLYNKILRLAPYVEAYFDSVAWEEALPVMYFTLERAFRRRKRFVRSSKRSRRVRRLLETALAD